jgi:Protein of unknown function (DUF4058)
VLDVQAAFARVYEAGSFHLRIDYGRSPVPPLDGEVEKWANELLINAGLRDASDSDNSTSGPSPKDD